MRIGIDARMMGASQTRGIGRYTEEMIKALLPLLQEGEQLVLFERDPSSSPIRDERVKHIEADIPWYGLAEQIKFPFILRREKLDVLWVPHWNIPLLYFGRIAVTIHDLLLITQKQSAKISTRSPILFYTKYLAFRLTLFFALHRAKAIFPPTKTIRDELMDFAPHAREKIHVTGEGVTHMQKSEERLMSEPYLFYVGSAYPHKRLDLLLDAWTSVAQNHPELRLVIGGEKDVFMKRHESRVEREQIPRVRFLGRVKDDDLSAWLSGTKGFVFPSGYEGLGLPPLEALLCGTPVVAADIPVLREVLPEEGVIFFENDDANDMIRAIETLLRRGDELKEMAEKGAERIRSEHAWEKAARTVIEVLRTSGSKHNFHDRHKETTRRTSDMEENEQQSRA